MKQKTYTVDQPKTKNTDTIKIKVDWLSIPNKMHLDAQINHPAKVFEDRRFKKPKHKNKEYENVRDWKNL